MTNSGQTYSHEKDDLDIYLDNWEPSLNLNYATLPQNLNDAYIRKRFVDNLQNDTVVPRTAYARGIKVMSKQELQFRGYEFFEGNQSRWSAEFRNEALSEGVPEEKLDTFLLAFAEDWIDGAARRQNSSVMMAIKASIRDYDAAIKQSAAGKYVINSIDSGITALFEPHEMAKILELNNRFIEAYFPDYLDYLGNDAPRSLDELYVRRGVYMETQQTFRKELHYLSSYSLALGPVEQFAQQYTPSTEGRGTPTIFSGPISAIQDRVVAFAPFIENMSISQLEFVIAPPLQEITLKYHEEHGGIHEYSFS